jgi:glycosyltransferase involved in cell wall biosynthesis
MNIKCMKPKILVFTRYYLPGHLGGGPIRSVSNIVSKLGDKFDFYIFTGDRDLGDPSHYADVEIDAWNQVGNAKVFYASPSCIGLLSLYRFLKYIDYDLIYLNSFFDYDFSIKPLFLRWIGVASSKPFLIAPRGEFSSGALAIKKLKKSAYIFVAKITRLISGIYYHASTEFEKEDIVGGLFDNSRRKENGVFIFNAPVLSAPDLSVPLSLTNLDSFSLTKRGTSGTLKVCFLSRISPKKNLDFALDVLAKTRIKIDFTIYGPPEDLHYWRLCEEKIRDLHENIRVYVAGSIPNSHVGSALLNHDVFFFPTRGENFGHVFAEAWGAGLPVLTSDQTPWRGLTELKLGWDIPLARQDEFIRILNVIAKYDDTEWQQVRTCCLKKAISINEDASAYEANMFLFTSCLSF